VFALTRSAGVADPAVLEVAWDEPALGAAQDEVMTLHAPPGARLPLDDGAAGAVVLSDPPRDSLPELIHEAKRVATSAIVLSVDLPAVAGRMASELAPDGWVGQEHRGVGKHVLEWADASDRRAEIAAELGLSGIQDRDGWLALFAAGTFGETHRRLFAFFPEAPEDPPDSVRVDAQRVERWRPPPPDPRPSEERRGAVRRALGWVWR
jgi:hypothetical protein